MKVSYNWLKWYIPDVPPADKLADIITYHLAEVETVEKVEDGDSVLDIKILPNRGHDLLSHMGIASEVASLLNISYIDPAPKYKIPESTPTNLKVEIKSDKCKRYMGRTVRNIEIDKSPEWVKKHLESIGQRSINNIVDATNIVMFNCGEPTHVFDADKIKGSLVARQARDGEKVTILGGQECALTSADFVVADEEKALIIGGVKGGTAAEVDVGTKNIVLEVGNFDAVAVRKTSMRIGVRTEGSKRWENGVSPELAPCGMRELSALIAEMCPEAVFEDVVDIYPVKQEIIKLPFSSDEISKILGLQVSPGEIESILKRYNFEYTGDGDSFDVTIQPLRLDLITKEDMAEEIGRILGYDKIIPKIPKIKFTPEINDTYSKIRWAKNKLLEDGYSEVMTYAFSDRGDVEVLQSASDKKFLRTNLADGLKESVKLNHLNTPLLGINEVKIFEIGTVFEKTGEKIHVAYNKKEKITETTLEDFCKNMPEDFKIQSESHNLKIPFKMWSLFPFIARDVAVWVPSEVKSKEVSTIIRENAGDLVVRGPELFDEFKKDGKVSYAFRIVFQSQEKTLTDEEVNAVMKPVYESLKAEQGFEIR